MLLVQMMVKSVILLNAVSLILVKFMGLIGVILGTCVAYVAFPIWVEPLIVYHYYYKKSVKCYWKKWTVYFVLAVCITLVTYLTCAFLPDNLTYFFVRIGICLILPNAIMLALFYKTDEFRFYLGMIKRIFTKKKKQLVII